MSLYTTWHTRTNSRPKRYARLLIEWATPVSVVAILAFLVFQFPSETVGFIWFMGCVIFAVCLVAAFVHFYDWITYNDRREE